MYQDPLITSILTRYERNLPVSSEEKAVLHNWLGNAVKSCEGQRSTLHNQHSMVPCTGNERDDREFNITMKQRRPFEEDLMLTAPEITNSYIINDNRTYSSRNLISRIRQFFKSRAAARKV